MPNDERELAINRLRNERDYWQRHDLEHRMEIEQLRKRIAELERAAASSPVQGARP
jgi:hypothetical protein